MSSWIFRPPSKILDTAHTPTVCTRIVVNRKLKGAAYGTNANGVDRLNNTCPEPIKIVYKTNFFFLKASLLRVCFVTLLLVQDDKVKYLRRI